MLKSIKYLILLVGFTALATPLSELKSLEQTSVELFLKELPAEIKANPVFIYKSFSLQEASFTAPRALLTSPDGKLTFAFNGHSSQMGFDRIEAMEFIENEARFQFYEITFDGKNKPTLSLPNPPQCLQCHRADPRPNWESYDLWPGSFASEDDRLTANEFVPFVNFLKNAPTHSRYSTLSLDHLQEIIGYSSHRGRLPKEPNISFTHAMSARNFERVIRLIQETPQYESFKYLIAGSLQCGTSAEWSEFLPPQLKPLLFYYSKKHIAETRQNPASIGSEFTAESTLQFRSLFESRGIDTSDWFMSFKGGLNNTFLNGSAWQEEVFDALLKKEPELKDYMAFGSESQLDCNALASKSVEKLEKLSLPLADFEKDPQVPKRIWQTSCRQCHEITTPFAGPQMSFEQARARPNFRAFIENGKMPKDQKLTPTERQRLLEN